MPSCSRLSPTALIQDWLLHTEEGNRAERQASLSKEQRTNGGKHRRHQHRNVEAALLPRHSGRARIESRDCDKAHREAENRYLPTSLEHGSGNLPQRLGLRTPFRTLNTNPKISEAKEDVAISSPKHKRSLSSTGLYIRPKASRRFVTEAGDNENAEYLNPTGHAAESDEHILQLYSHTPPSSAVAPNFVETNAKSYKRKPRHKTREDHYTLKNALKVTKHKVDEGEHPFRKRGKGKRREKSGSALMHDFTARNIALNRLTLRSAPAVGIFSKGRASSPIKRMGLPDLAFSEVTFLKSKSRSKKPESLDEPLERSSGRRKGRFADDDAEVSRYFTSNNGALPHRMRPELELLAAFRQPRLGSKREEFQARQERQSIKGEPPHRLRPVLESLAAFRQPRLGCKREEFQARQERQSIKGEPQLPLLDLPETPFLGFGSSGFSMSSPMKSHETLKTPFLGFGSSGFSKSSPMKSHETLKTPNRTARALNHLVTPTRSTTYYTWSRSGALTHDSGLASPISKPPPKFGLNHECRPNREPVGQQTERHQDIQMEHSSGDDALRQSETIAEQAEGLRNSPVGQTERRQDIQMEHSSGDDALRQSEITAVQAEGLRNPTYHFINSPVSHDPFADVVSQDSFQAYRKDSQDQQFALGSDQRLEEDQNYPQHNFSNLEQPRDYIEHDYVLFKRNPEYSSCLWNQASPFHDAEALLYGSAGNLNRSSTHQDVEGDLAGFWKPHLLY